MYPLLRLDKPRLDAFAYAGFLGYLLTRTTPFKVLLPAAACCPCRGFSLGSGEMGWIFALLVCSAAVTAIVQQTLP